MRSREEERICVMKEVITDKWYCYAWLNEEGFVYFLGKGKRGSRSHHRPKANNNPPMPTDVSKRKVIHCFPTETLALNYCKKVYAELCFHSGWKQMEVLSRQTWWDRNGFGGRDRDQVDDERSMKKKGVEAHTKTGEFVGRYESIGEAAMELNIGRTNISNMLLGKQKSAGGYIFSYC